MTSCRLVQRRILDPRLADDAERFAIDDSVNIPLAELPRRTHELPPRETIVTVAAIDDTAARAVAWLQANGRLAAATDDFKSEISNLKSEIGRLWSPASFLEQVADLLPRGAALDLACGSGRESVYLASRGYGVTAVDILPDALDKARNLASRCAAAIRPIRFLQMDLESETPAFDQRFDLIIAFRYLHRPLLARLGNWLNPGGFIVYETFTTLHRQQHGKPARDAFVLRPGELHDLLAGFEILEYSEDWRGSAHTARALARMLNPPCRTAMIPPME